jgi:hypothetical protein
MKRATMLCAALLAMGTSLAASPARAEEDKAAAALAAFKASFKEPGRVGILGAITDDLWKGGLVFEHEYFEFILLGHTEIVHKSLGEVHVLSRGGGRTNLGALNYLAYGVELGTHPGARDNGVHVGKGYEIGPYISLQRYFAATPLMITLWVNPFLFEHNVSASPAGGTVSQNGLRILQTGGFGLCYLFGGA